MQGRIKHTLRHASRPLGYIQRKLHASRRNHTRLTPIHYAAIFSFSCLQLGAYKVRKSVSSLMVVGIRVTLTWYSQAMIFICFFKKRTDLSYTKRHRVLKNHVVNSKDKLGYSPA